VEAPGHPFYRKLNLVLTNAGLDQFCEQPCGVFYADKKGRPSLPPGVYFRLMLIGFFEGLDSERGIAWRTADSLSLRQCIGLLAEWRWRGTTVAVPPVRTRVSAQGKSLLILVLCTSKAIIADPEILGCRRSSSASSGVTCRGTQEPGAVSISCDRTAYP